MPAHAKRPSARDAAELAFLRTLYRYNSYVRKKYLAALEKIPTVELLRGRGASYPSLLDIFLHVLDAYRAWFVYRYEGKEWDSKQQFSERVTSLAVASREERKIDAYLRALLGRLRPRDLRRTIRFPDNGRILQDTLRDILWHMVEEELQHRGELNALLWQMDVEPPVTDWIDWKIETGQPGPAVI